MALPLAVTATPAASTGPCARVEVTSFGSLGCRAPGGWYFEAGGRWSFTHGGDIAPSDGAGAITRAKPNMPPCVSDPRREFHVQMLYVHASDSPDQYHKRASLVREMLLIANGVLVNEAKRFKRTVEVRVACKNDQPWIRNVKLPTAWDDTHAGTVFNDLIDAGFDSVLAKYWVWFDGHPPNVGELGIAQSYPYGQPNSPSHPANLGAMTAITWGGTGAGGINTMLHEGGHTLGAVSITSPNSTGGAHCIDGPDVMCYRDGGPRAEAYRANICARAHFDCNNDDYFHPKPGKKNYLYRNWNLASPMNRFLAGCTFGTGVLTVPGAGHDPEALTNPLARDIVGATSLIAAHHAVPKKCRGLRFAVSAVVEPPAEVFQQAPNGVEPFLYQVMPATLREPDVDVCWYAKAELLRCNSAGRYESGTVPKTATRARVLLRAGTSAIYTFSIV